MLAASRWQAVVAAPAPLVPAAAPSYARHAPERTLLYALVQAHYPDFIARVEAEDRPLPEYVREEFDAYLRCGVLEHGFLRVVCGQCHAERLLRFSCKKRGFCPSCGARRMAESARHLVETVFGPHRAHRPQRPRDTPPTAQPTANRHPIRYGHAPAGARSARCRESARNGYGSAPKPALAWPPPTRQTGRKGRLNFLYSSSTSRRSPFSRAFRREYGAPPASWRRNQATQAHAR